VRMACFADRLLAGEDWTFEWWDDADDTGRLRLTGELTQKVTEEEQ
jgi:hypothetical protein